MDLADSSTKQSVISSLHGELQTERAKLAAANKKVTANNASCGLLGTCCLIISTSTSVVIINCTYRISKSKMKFISGEGLLRTNFFLSGYCSMFFMQALELQQRLTSVELQLHEEEVLVQKINSLERDNRNLSDSLSVLREKQHEEKTTR